MKPIQVHRILKERIVSESTEIKPLGLIPLVHHGKEFHLRAHPIVEAVVPHKGSHSSLPKLETAEQKRIKELEKETFRLNHHVQQAEQTMRGYRNLMAKYNINPSEPADAKLPVVPQCNSPPPKAPDNELDELTAQLTAMGNKLVQSEAENLSLLQKMADLRNQQGNLQELIARNEALQQGVRIRERRIQEVENEMVSLKSELAVERKRTKLLGQTVTEALSAVQQLKAEMSELKPDITQTLGNVSGQMNGQLMALLGAMKAQQQQRQQSTHSETEKWKLRCLTAEASVAKLSTELLHANSHMNAVSIIASKSADVTQSQLHVLSADLQQAQQQLAHYNTQLQTINTAVSDLATVHMSELKAVKHLAHIKELKRVAKEREDLLDRDRLCIEIKFLQ